MSAQLRDCKKGTAAECVVRDCKKGTATECTVRHCKKGTAAELDLKDRSATKCADQNCCFVKS